MDYLPTIGLEIHAELKTGTKMFCGCKHDPEEKEPNKNICPICAGHPGTLPTINMKAVELVVKVGLAVGGAIANKTKFDRKNYFYPDLPKGYQISQYDEPLVSAGSLEGVRITRIHLEEDAGRLVHDVSRSTLRGSSFVDFNRAGLPLMELVTEPDIEDAETAVRFAKSLQRILRYLNASDADMERGQMRVEANVSIRKSKTDPLGTKVEVKNINSFRAVGDAIAFEIDRQAKILDKGEHVVQETRGWDDVRHVTVSQRSKEEAHDYRYFPEPDLPPLMLAESDINVSHLREHLPELPNAKRDRFVAEFGLLQREAETLIDDKDLAEYFENAISELATEDGGKTKEARTLLFNYLTTDLRGLLAESNTEIKTTKITPENFADLIILIHQGKLSSRSAKDLLRRMHESGGDPREFVKSEGLEQISDNSALETVAKEIIAANPKAIEDYKKGKTASLQFLVGKAMAQLKGKGNPGVLQEVFKKLL